MKLIPIAIALGYSVWGRAFPPNDALHVQVDQLVLTSDESKTGAPVLASQSDVIELSGEKTIYEVLQSYPGSVLPGRKNLDFS